MDMRFTKGDGASIAPLTAELLALRPDVFVAGNDTMAVPAAASTATVPIVFAVGIDPVGYGVVNSLARTGRNVTGFGFGGPELGIKFLSLLKEAVPGLKVVGVLVGKRDRYKVEYLEEARRSLGLVLVQFELTRPDQTTSMRRFKRLLKRVPAASWIIREHQHMMSAIGSPRSPSGTGCR
jgi:putative ABC transport system substrate-binding protein